MTEPKALKYMTFEEAMPIYQAFHADKPLEFLFGGEEWEDWIGDICREITYRVKQTKPSINWDHVKSRCICLARDESGVGYLYSEIPEQGAISWTQGTPECGVGGFASYDPGTCDWKKSLVIRPGHEQD